MDDDHKRLEENAHKPDEEPMDEGGTDKTNYTGVFLSIGAGLGVSFGVIFDQLTLGISLGTALGLVIGAVVESTKKRK